MKTTLTIACMMAALCAVGAVQKPSAKKTSLSETELRTLAKADPDVKNAGSLYLAAMAMSNNVERKQTYLKAAAACLIACDKQDIYTKRIKGELQDVADFESELKDDCKRCSGSGKRGLRCYACSGKGKCSVCKGAGQVRAVKYSGFNKYHVSKPCTKCNESGNCQRCDGKGSVEEKCSTCAGTGKAFSKVVATRVFRDSCSALADSMTTPMVSTNARVNPKEKRTARQIVVKKDTGDEANMIPKLIKAAEQGDPRAQFELGRCYAKGKGVNKSVYEAVNWYRKAAQQGFAEAQCVLGFCYDTGEGVAKDDEEAVKWYRKAAEQGYAQAQFLLGFCYDTGKGIAKDDEEAVKWYRKAAGQGVTEAQLFLGDRYITGKGVTKDYEEAVKWLRKAAEQGDAIAQYHLGMCYSKGEGVSKNEYEAARWYRKASAQGKTEAQCVLGLCYIKGTGVREDYEEGVKWIRKAAEQGDKTAIEVLRKLGVEF